VGDGLRRPIASPEEATTLADGLVEDWRLDGRAAAARAEVRDQHGQVVHERTRRTRAKASRS
jgi:hypothetical protein